MSVSFSISSNSTKFKILAVGFAALVVLSIVFFAYKNSDSNNPSILKTKSSTGLNDGTTKDDKSWGAQPVWK